MTYNKEIREEFNKFVIHLNVKYFASMSAQEAEEIADWWLERTLPRSELKKWVEGRKPGVFVFENKREKEAYRGGYNQTLSDLTERFGL